MNSVHRVRANNHLRDVIEEHPMRRIEIDAERTSHTTREFTSRSRARAPTRDSPGHEERTERREDIIKARANAFTASFDRATARGRASAEREPTRARRRDRAGQFCFFARCFYTA